MTCTWLEISKEAFTHNVLQIQRIIDPVKLGIVIKSDGYGHGLEIMAQLAQGDERVACVFVTNSQEALRARQTGLTKPIVVLAYYNTPFEQVLENAIDCVCYDLTVLEAISKAAQAVQKVARIHLKIDTGMTRLGINPEQVEKFVQKIQADPWVSLVGVMSHCADSSVPDSVFIQRQVKLFDSIVDSIKEQVTTLEWIHCCSSGSFLLSRNHTVVRVGSNLYGCWKSSIQKKMLQENYLGFSLRQLITWKATIVAIKHVPFGRLIGYSCTFTAERDMVIAFVPVGYAEGYPRELSNRGFVIVKGQQAGVVGMVSMGLLVIDVTDISGVNVSDEVQLLADQLGLRVDDWAQKTGRFNLDILTRFHSSLKREII